MNTLLLLICMLSSGARATETLEAFEALELSPIEEPALSNPDLRPRLEVSVGPAIPLGDLGATLLPRVELGRPIARGSLVPVVSLTGANPATSGVTDEARIAGGATAWQVRAWSLALGGGLRWLPFDPDEAVRAELGVSALLVVQRVVQPGSAWEWLTVPGATASFSLAGEVGPLTLVGGLGVTAFALHGTLLGDGLYAGLAPFLGLRFPLGSPPEAP